MKPKKGLVATFAASAVLAASAAAGVAAQGSPADPVVPVSPAATLNAAAQTSRHTGKAHHGKKHHAQKHHAGKHHGHKKHKHHKHKHHHKHKKPPSTTIGERHLYKWAEHQLGKYYNPWKIHECLQFTDDGMEAAGLHPLRMHDAALAWRTYAATGRAHAWGTHMNKLKPGDLVFWGSYQGGITSYGHVGIYAGKGEVIENLGGMISKDSVYWAANGAAPSGWVKVGKKKFIAKSKNGGTTAPKKMHHRPG